MAKKQSELPLELLGLTHNICTHRQPPSSTRVRPAAESACVCEPFRAIGVVPISLTILYKLSQSI
eukprot:1986212-Amphidinium_carterae.1